MIVKITVLLPQALELKSQIVTIQYQIKLGILNHQKIILLQVNLKYKT